MSQHNYYFKKILKTAGIGFRNVISNQQVAGEVELLN